MNCSKCGIDKPESELISGLCFWDDCYPDDQEFKATMRVAELLYGMPETTRERVMQRALSRVRNDQDEVRESARFN